MAFAIVAATLLTTVYLGILGGLVAAVAVEDPATGFWAGWFLILVPAVMLLAGWVQTRRRVMESAMGTRVPDRADARRLRGATERLCAIADLEPPDTQVVGDRLPLSWTTSPPWGTPRIHVTTGMLDALPERELLAVIAHELAHIAHRDAAVMTLVGGPSVYIMRAVRRLLSEDWFRGTIAVACFSYFILPAIVFGLLSRIVSRHRELAADRSAALITGSPAALASALVRLREDMTDGDILLVDLQLAAPRNQFHVIPVERREPHGVRRIWASHPRLAGRLEQLDHMERNLQWARGPGAGILEDEPETTTTRPAAPPPPPPQRQTAPGSAESSPAAPAG
jgi:heat shock protein HtpX